MHNFSTCVSRKQHESEHSVRMFHGVNYSSEILSTEVVL